MSTAPTESSPRLLWSKTGRALGLAVLGFAALQWMPGLEPLRWAPDDPLAFAPALFRPTPPEETEAAAPREVDEAALVTAGPGAIDGPADDDDIPVGLRPVDALSAGIEPIDDPDDIDDGEPEPPATALIWDPDAQMPPEPAVRRTASGLALMPIEDPQGNLRRFYRALARSEAGEAGALTRVVHYGDSLITGDYVTQTVRRLMQQRFGDGGHGFVLAGRPSPWYRRANLELSTSDAWNVNRITRPTIADGAYGLGAVTVRTRKRGEWVRMKPRDVEAPKDPDAPVDEIGTRVSRMQVMYLAQPNGGQFQMSVGGAPAIIDTRTEEKASRIAEIMAPDGAHTFKLRTLGRGEVRLFGVVFERPGPGVVYDSLGLDGARAKLLRRIDQAHWHEQLRLRRPDLLVLHYGTNESQARRLSARRYRDDLTQIVGGLRAALPGVSCLLVGPMDRAERAEGSGKLVTRPVVKRIVRVQREVAWRQGCAFWNTYRAMGGEGSMAKWYRMKPKLASGDLTHPTRRGADRIGQMLYVALIDGYQRFFEGEDPAAPAPAPPVLEIPPELMVFDEPVDVAPPVEPPDAPPAAPGAAPPPPVAAPAMPPPPIVDGSVIEALAPMPPAAPDPLADDEAEEGAESTAEPSSGARRLPIRTPE